MYVSNDNLSAAGLTFSAVGGIGIAILVFTLLYFLSMTAYFAVRKKYAYSKFGVEIAFMAIVLLLSFSARFLLFLQLGAEEGIYDNNTIGEIIGTALRAAYSSIGQLTFEGLEDYAQSEVPLAYWMYYWGTAVYCGVMFLSIVTTKISYEIYSRGGVSRIANARKTGDLFIFRNATKDALTLAESIEKSYAEYDAEYAENKRNYAKEYVKLKGTSGAEFESYAEMGRKQKEADTLKVELNELTKTYIDAWFASLSPKLDTCSSETRDFIVGVLLPSVLWTAIAAKFKTALSEKIFSRRSFLDFYSESGNYGVYFTEIRTACVGETGDASELFSAALKLVDKTKDGIHSSEELVFALREFAFVDGDVPALESKSCGKIHFPSGVLYSGAKSKKSVDAGLLFGQIVEKIGCYVRIIEKLITSVSSNEYAAKRKLKKPRKCRILFLGDSLEPFDGNDPLHREIMAHDYYYVSYVRNSKSPVSVFKKFGFKTSNDFIGRICEFGKTCKIHVFSFALNENEQGDEAFNGSDVFSEIELLFTECVSKNNVLPDLPIVNYYILSDNQVNYETYDKRLSGMLKEIIRKYRVRMTVEEAMSHFRLNIVNEAAVSAKCLVRRRAEVFVPESRNGSLVEESKPFDYGVFSDNNEFRVAVLGFGQTGQAAMKELFINSAYVRRVSQKQSTAYVFDENGKDRIAKKVLELSGGEPTQFVADVFDSDADNVAGLFAFRHPSFICAKGEEEISVRNFEETYGYCLSNLLKSYAPLCPDVRSFAGLREGVGFPMLFFHAVSCNGMDFLRELDRSTGEENYLVDRENAQYSVLPKRSPYKAFIIALGNDERNISVANALIDDIGHEISRKTDRGSILHQTIYVNIRDERNYGRLRLSEKMNLTVIPFGKRTDIYSYDYIIETSNTIRYNTSYDYLSKELQEGRFDRFAVKFRAEIMDENTIKSANIGYLDLEDESGKQSLMDSMRGVLLKVEDKFRTYGNMRKWYELSLFTRQSNISSYDFGAFFRQYLQEKGGWNNISSDDVLQLADIEHTRWDRFHIAQGWVYSKNKSVPSKEHNCLVPFDSLYKEKPGVLLYDLGNVIAANARKYGERNE